MRTVPGRRAARPSSVRARERLAGYKVPCVVTLPDEFPFTPNGKVQKFRVRELPPHARPGPPEHLHLAWRPERARESKQIIKA